jgi:PIN domain nuclease of toxin-antitoxin system
MECRAEVIVLDTHAWLWWVAAPEHLSQVARHVIDDEDRVGVCSMSCWEVVMLERHGRLRLDRDPASWVRPALGNERVETLDLDSEIAVAAALLDSELFPGDPADRVIYATARARDARLVTRDGAMREFDATATIW